MMTTLKNISISLALLCMLLVACKEKTRVDLAKISFKEKAGSIINYKDKYAGGVNTLESPLSFALQAVKSSSFSFNGLPLDSVDIIFQLRSDKIRKDTSLYQSGASVDQVHVKDQADLSSLLKKYQADSVIYAYRVGIKTPEQQLAVLKNLTKLYGSGIKNPNTAHGLYWNLKLMHPIVFFAPDYNWLIVVDNTHLSQTCFWDPSIGDMDLGGCDVVQYKADLLK